MSTGGGQKVFLKELIILASFLMYVTVLTPFFMLFLPPFLIPFLPPFFHTIPTPIFHTSPFPIFHIIPTPCFSPLPQLLQQLKFESKFVPLPVIGQSLPKAIPEDNPRFWLQNQMPSSWGSALAQVGRVGQASTNTGRFQVGCSRYWLLPEENVLPLSRYWLSSRVNTVSMISKFRPQGVTFFFMQNEIFNGIG